MTSQFRPIIDPGHVGLQTIASSSPLTPPLYGWLVNGVDFRRKLLDALAGATDSIRLESYIYADDDLGREVRAALINASRRGVSVRVLVDAVGSLRLGAGFWQPLEYAGGEARIFNPIAIRRLPIRNHRKLVVVDNRVAGVGGFNVADVYAGDGIFEGWRDLGLATHDAGVVEALARSFDRIFESAAVIQPQVLMARLGRGHRPPPEPASPTTQLLVHGPGRSLSAFERLFREDVAAGDDIRIVSAYFLPTFPIRRLLRAAARRGARVQIIVPGKSDVPVAQRAARFLYQTLMKAGVEIWEYQPQILHAKLFLANGAVYAGSSNLDTRSLHINFELMLRVSEANTVSAAGALFKDLRQHSRRIDPVSWKTSRGPIERLRERWAFWLLSRVDPYVSRWLALGPR